MRATRTLTAVIVLQCVGLAVTSAGWYRSNDPGNLSGFDSCRIEDGTAVLTYTYGANEKVTLEYRHQRR